MEEFTSKNNRREFIKNCGLAGLAFTLPDFDISKHPFEKVTLLYTNDWHSRIEPFPMSHPEYANRGGAARRAAIIDKIRKEEKNVLLLDAGDMVQGTPYFNFYNGELEISLMNQMGYTAATLGNHDFDNGMEGLEKLLSKANFSVINCNYTVKDSSIESFITPYKVYKFGKIRIGLTGVGIELNGLVPKPNFKGLIYNDPVESVNKIAARLKYDYKCDYVIALSHLGFEYKDNKISDKGLATLSKDIDLILGGHTHTYIENLIEIKNRNNLKVNVSQMGWAGLYLGRIDLIFRYVQRKSDEKFSLNELFTKSIAI
jgi:5'-nucleotidase